VIGLLQRVSRAAVRVDGETVGAIGAGLLVLVGVERGDGEAQAERLLQRLLGYRVFADAQGRMNRSLTDCGGGLLLVPQFTLPADTRKGMRPSFTPAAAPADGERLFEHLLARARAQRAGVTGDETAGAGVAGNGAAGGEVASGRFGADMQVELVNDGPVTFWLRVPPAG